MCVHFFNFDHLRIKLWSSNLIWGTKFRAPSLPLPLLIFFYLQALIHGFLWWWASSWLIFSLKWHLQSSFFLIHYASHWTSRIKGLHWWKKSKAYKLHMELHHVVSRASLSRWCYFASSTFLFGQFCDILKFCKRYILNNYIYKYYSVYIYIYILGSSMYIGGKIRGLG